MTPDLLFSDELLCCSLPLDVPSCSSDDLVSTGDPVSTDDLVSTGDIRGIMLPALLGSGGLYVPSTCRDHFGEPETGDRYLDVSPP